MQSFVRDVIYGLRLFRRNPAFSSLSVIIIALGIGATAAIFSLIHAIILNPLPYRQPDQLAVIWTDFSKSGGNRRAFTTAADYFDWRQRSRSFESFAAYSNSSRTLTALDQPVTPLTHEVTANYFDMLGVRALKGRTFLAGEDLPGRDRVAIISHALWKTAFAGSENAIGKTIELDGQNAQLIGVLPPGFRVPNNAITVQPDLWVPASFDNLRQDRAQRTLVVFGRLRPNVGIEQSRAEMAAIEEQIVRENPVGSARTTSVQSVRDALTGEVRGTFLLLLAAVGIMLLIACANVANLLLARSISRAREVAVRTALGASQGQIVRQMLTESFTLFLIGGSVGVLLAKWSIAPLLGLVPESAGLPFAEQVEVNTTVLCFALALSAITALVFGLVPARQAVQGGLANSLKDAGRSRTGSRSGGLFRSVLIVAEIALSLMLLTGASLMVQTFWRLSRLDSGFDAGNVLTVRNSLRGESYAANPARQTYFHRAAAKLATLPGVESVSAISFPLPVAPVAPARFIRPNRPGEPGNESTAITLSVLPRFFETVRIPILSGRPIADGDTVDSARVAVISKTLATRYFADSDPVGQTIRLTGRMPTEIRIVGVAGDVRGSGLSPEPQPILYFPFDQQTLPTMTFLLRTRVNPASLGGAAERTLWSLGGLMNVYQVVPLEQRVAESYWQSRFTMILLSVFAVVAVILASAGIFAVISYLASQRTREIGIRMALGARPADIIRMVTGEGAMLAGIGIAFGLAASLALGRLVSAQLYGITATDPLTFIGVAFLLALVAVAACAAPAIRASRTDPLEALRTD